MLLVRDDDGWTLLESDGVTRLERPAAPLGWRDRLGCLVVLSVAAWRIVSTGSPSRSLSEHETKAEKCGPL